MNPGTLVTVKLNFVPHVSLLGEAPHYGIEHTITGKVNLNDMGMVLSVHKFHVFTWAYVLFSGPKLGWISEDYLEKVE